MKKQKELTPKQKSALALAQAVQRVQWAQEAFDFADEAHLDIAILELTSAKLELSALIQRIKVGF